MEPNKLNLNRNQTKPNCYEKNHYHYQEKKKELFLNLLNLTSNTSLKLHYFLSLSDYLAEYWSGSSF